MKADAILPAITEAANVSQKGLLVFIISHDRIGALFDTDGIAVPITSIQNKMQTKSLTSKPKLLFIAACQAT